MSITPGTTLGRYEIRALLGAGGMGEVYLAEDTELERPVALKLLRADAATEPEWLQRFVQEARAASALNHPNILTVYEIGQLGERRYMVTEFIRGEMLRQRLTRARLSLRECCDIALQVAAALAAAHEAGIVHRDIKPENVMVRPDGLVKILDFGLAKLTERHTAGQTFDPAAPTRVGVHTTPGMVMGTAHYMSPEQARGLEVDERTDIWSLGVVLYELVTGHVPFAGETMIDIAVSILDGEPQPLAAYEPNAPPELQRIVRKALQKNRAERYQTIKDLLLDLKSLNHELERAQERERSGLPPAPVSSTAARALPTRGAATAGGHTASGPSDRAARPTSYFLGGVRRHKAGALVGLGVLLVVCAALAYGVYRFAIAREAGTHFQAGKFTPERLTVTGSVDNVSVSPDGKTVAYVLTEGDRSSLCTRSVETAGGGAIVQPGKGISLSNTTFSPDGNYIYYLQQEKAGPPDLYRVSVLGGQPKKVLTNISSPVTFSPDARRFAFVRQGNDESSLIVANAPDGGGESFLAARRQVERFLEYGASWSPDGKTIALGALNKEGRATVLGVAPEGGAVTVLTQQRWERVGRVAWFGDGRWLAFIATERAKPDAQIWRLSYPSGEAQRITNDLHRYNYNSLSLTADNSALVTALEQRTATISVAPLNDLDHPRRLTPDNTYDGIHGVAWTPDGRNIVYFSARSGNYDIFVMDKDGQTSSPLAASPDFDWCPAVSPDGRYVVFTSRRSGQENLWRMNIDGTDQEQLTNGEPGYYPVFSPDGRWVVYVAGGIWRVPFAGGQPEQVSGEPANYAAVAPDGKRIAYSSSDKSQVGIIAFDGGAELKTLDFNPNPDTNHDPLLRWLDDQSLLYVDASQGGANIWVLPLDGSRQPYPLTHFPAEQLWSFDVTPDHKQLVYSHGSVSKYAVLLREENGDGTPVH